MRALRFAGWVLMSAGLSWYPLLVFGFEWVGDAGSDRFFPWIVRGAVAPAAMLLVGGACLIRARVMVGRKRRFLRRHRESEGVEVSLAPLGAGLRLGLRW